MLKLEARELVRTTVTDGREDQGAKRRKREVLYATSSNLSEYEEECEREETEVVKFAAKRGPANQRGSKWTTAASDFAKRL